MMKNLFLFVLISVSLQACGAKVSTTAEDAAAGGGSSKTKSTYLDGEWKTQCIAAGGPYFVFHIVISGGDMSGEVFIHATNDCSDSAVAQIDPNTGDPTTGPVSLNTIYETETTGVPANHAVLDSVATNDSTYGILLVSKISATEAYLLSVDGVSVPTTWSDATSLDSNTSAWASDPTSKLGMIDSTHSGFHMTPWVD